MLVWIFFFINLACFPTFICFYLSVKCKQNQRFYKLSEGAITHYLWQRGNRTQTQTNTPGMTSCCIYFLTECNWASGKCGCGPLLTCRGHYMCSSSLHVFCGLGEGLQLCPSRSLLGGTVRVRGTLVPQRYYETSGPSITRESCASA